MDFFSETRFRALNIRSAVAANNARMTSLANKTCSICKVMFPLEHFYVRSDRNKPIARCRACNKIASKVSKDRRSPEQVRRANKARSDWYLKQASEGNIRAIVQHKHNMYRHNAIAKSVPFDVTTEYLVRLFERQEGLCYYTGVKLECTRTIGAGHIHLGNRPNQMSLDRKIPALGYIVGNLVWCSYIANTCKNMLSENDFYKMCSVVLNRAASRQSCQDSVFNTLEEE